MNATAPIRVEHEAPCIKCGYNLRGLPYHGRCPECNEEISKSFRGELLRFADLSWLIQVVRGLALAKFSQRLILWCFLGMIVVLVFGMLLIQPNADTLGERILELVLRIIPTLMVFAVFGLGIGFAIAARKEPRFDDKPAPKLTLLRWFSFAVMPVFGIWSAAGTIALVISGGAIARQMLIHVCFAIVWWHAGLMITFAESLRQRCEAVDSGFQKSMRKWRDEMVIVPILFLAAYWIGPIRWSATGGWTMPVPASEKSLVVWSAIGWVLIAGAATGCLPTVRREAAKAPRSHG